MNHFLFILAIFFLFGCSSIPSSKGTEESLLKDSATKIEKVYWVLVNIPKGFSKNLNPELSCFATLSIVYDGDIDAGDIIAAGVSNGRLLSQNIALDDNVDYRKKIIGTRYITEGSLTSPFSGNTFPIGRTFFWFETSDTALHSQYLDIPEPGSLSSGGNNLIYTENATAGPDDDLSGFTGMKYKIVPALRRPRIIEVSLRDMQVVVTFTESDRRAFSGTLFFYDSNQEKVCSSDVFRSYSTGIFSPAVNSGQLLNTDGRENMVKVNLGLLKYFPGKNVSDIRGCFIMITDGEQYLGAGLGYDCESYSERRLLDTGQI